MKVLYNNIFLNNNTINYVQSIRKYETQREVFQDTLHLKKKKSSILTGLTICSIQEVVLKKKETVPNSRLELNGDKLLL